MIGYVNYEEDEDHWEDEDHSPEYYDTVKNYGEEGITITTIKLFGIRIFEKRVEIK